eukprot:g4764.t1
MSATQGAASRGETPGTPPPLRAAEKSLSEHEQSQIRRQHRLLRDAVRDSYSGARAGVTGTPALSRTDSDPFFSDKGTGLVLVRADGSEPPCRPGMGQSVVIRRDPISRDEPGYLGHYVSRKGNFLLEFRAGHAQLSIINTQNLPLVSRNSHLRPIDEDPHEPNDPALLYAGDSIHVIGANNRIGLRGKPKMMYMLQTDGVATLSKNSLSDSSTREKILWVGQRYVEEIEGLGCAKIMLLRAVPEPCARIQVTGAICVTRSGDNLRETFEANKAWVCHLGDKFYSNGGQFEYELMPTLCDRDLEPERVFSTDDECNENENANRVVTLHKRGRKSSGKRNAEQNLFTAASVCLSGSDYTSAVVSPHLFPSTCSSCGDKHLGEAKLRPWLDELNSLCFLCAKCFPNRATLDARAKGEIQSALMRRNTGLCLLNLLQAKKHVLGQGGPPTKKLKALAEGAHLDNCQNMTDFCDFFEDVIDPKIVYTL